MKILLVEDDALLGEGIQTGLHRLGFLTAWVRDGTEALAALEGERHFSAIVLDLTLPRMDGLSLLRRLRAGNDQIPVIIMTGNNGKANKLAALDCGADDYVVKPVDLDELAARLRALIRRALGRAAPRLVCGDVELDPAARRAWHKGKPVDLSARELAVLESLMENAGRVMSRAQLEGCIYGWGEGAESNTVEVYIHYLRKKLGAGFIRTLRGIGYLIEDRARLPD